MLKNLFVPRDPSPDKNHRVQDDKTFKQNSGFSITNPTLCFTQIKNFILSILVNIKLNTKTQHSTQKLILNTQYITYNNEQ
ncbi:MAG TPA: hypothetical protein DEP28_04160 [Bacteroidetes bacterium]|nr:hypothetical protein [Bacteroidota bacterium]HCN36486.1 hypothetical protein [Bacteroidota bacterium]